MDYDDVALMGIPARSSCPALLGKGERLHASRLALMHACVKGYEVWGELIARDQDQHHAKGWHPTTVFSVVAVAAAMAALRQVPDVFRDAPRDRWRAGPRAPTQPRHTRRPKVRASIGVTQAAMRRNYDPHTGLEAKFSLEFAIAAALAVP
jgi:2-methylcitrate dehydratase PrpD